MKRTLVLVLTLAVAPRVVHAFWRLSCGIIQTGRIDPVVSYNSASSHVHKISGASNININSTQETLTSSSCTSCQIQSDKSAYWTPQLYYAHANGMFEEVPNGGMAVYYEGRGDAGGWQPFPKGLQFLSGNSAARSYDVSTLTAPSGGRPVADRVSFACIDYNNPMPQTPGFGNLTCPDGLRAQIQMQSCWDGVHLNSTSQSHMAYLSQIDNGVCPPGYPILLPHLFYEVLYSVDQINTSDGGHFMFSNGDTTGYGFHGDFMNGWDNSVLADAIANCLVQNPSGVVESCSSFSSTNSPTAANACTERSPVYPCEKVHGMLTSLPGCTTSGGVTTCPGGVQPACAASFATVGLVVSPGNNQYTSIGCYTEATTGRALSSKSYTDPVEMTIDTCLAFCLGYNYAGVEYGQECYCANTMAAGTSSASVNACSMPCKGNLSPTYGQICGGSSHLNIYQAKVPTSSSTSSSSSISSASSTSIRSSPTSQTTAASVGNYNYVGCYTEATSGRGLNLASKNDKAMTLEMCASYCSGLNYPMFGVEYGTECYCGTYIRKGSSIAPANDCRMTCGGDKSESCGGSSRLSTYAIKNYNAPSIPQTFDGYTYAGCYTEATTGRALASATKVDYGLMTLDTCAAFCKAYTMWGIEYGGECRCGNALGAGSVLAPGGDGECSTTCPGNYTQLACGAGGRFNLYKLPTAKKARAWEFVSGERGIML